MAEQFIRRELTIQVLTPLHIGCGEKLRRHSFVQEGRSLLVLDEDKLLDWARASEKNATVLEDFAEEADLPLDAFFKQQHLPAHRYMAYRVPVVSGEPRELQLFIKAPGHQPYVPGSSLKGAVRSGLLRGALLGDEEMRMQAGKVAGGLAYRGEDSDDLQAVLFVPSADVPEGRRPNYDLMRTLAFSDSTPAPAGALEVCEVKVLSARLGRNEERSLGFKAGGAGRDMIIYVEALKPGTRLTGSVLWNQALLDPTGPASGLALHRRRDLILGFCGVCQDAVRDLIDQEISFYQTHGQRDLQRFYEARGEELEGMRERQTFLWPLGWGTGYDAKTVTDLFGEQVFRDVAHHYKNTQRLGRPTGGDWLGPELSPKSRKVALRQDGKLEPMGWLRIEIKD